jgi:hypothetical protein
MGSDMDVIARSNDDDRKKQWSQHKFDIASEHIAFADPERGIFEASPVETMHASRKGVVVEKIKKVWRVFQQKVGCLR